MCLNSRWDRYELQAKKWGTAITMSSTWQPLTSTVHNFVIFWDAWLIWILSCDFVYFLTVPISQSDKIDLRPLLKEQVSNCCEVLYNITLDFCEVLSHLISVKFYHTWLLQSVYYHTGFVWSVLYHTWFRCMCAITLTQTVHTVHNITFLQQQDVFFVLLLLLFCSVTNPLRGIQVALPAWGPAAKRAALTSPCSVWDVLLLVFGCYMWCQGEHLLILPRQQDSNPPSPPTSSLICNCIEIACVHDQKPMSGYASQAHPRD